MNRLPEFGNLLYKALMNTEFQHHNDGHEVPWENADLLFLRDTIKRGMPHAKVAGFLGRSEARCARRAES
jgi:hypothetical protein